MGNGSLWETLSSQGKLTCFWHKESGAGMNSTIHSVFDVGFDESKGVIKVDSIINDGNNTSKTTYADGSNTSVGKLAAEASKDNNAFNVQKALYQAIKAGTVVNESAIVNEMEWKDPSANVDNPASQNTINEYNNYQKIKDVTDGKTEEKEKEVTINNKEYTLQEDPFKAFEESLVKDTITDYFMPFDYIFGDFSYGKIRFKGFYDSNNKNCKEMNDIKNLDNYLKNYCSYGCKWFLLKKM